MSCFIHIDEVNYDNTSEVSQSDLTGDEVCDSHIDIKGCLLLPRSPASLLATIDINDVHSLGLLNDNIGSIAQGNFTPEESLLLLCHTTCVKERTLTIVLIERDNLLSAWVNVGYVASELLVVVRIVDDDLGKALVVGVSDKVDSTVSLFINLSRSLSTDQLLDACLKSVYQIHHLLDELLGLLARSLRPNDGSIATLDDALHDGLEPRALLRGAYLARDGYLIAKGH